MYRLYLRSTDVVTDARIQKYLAACNRINAKYRVAHWRRSAPNGRPAATEDFVFSRESRIGAGLSNLWSIIAWNLFLARVIIRNRSEIELVHAVDLDSALLSYITCKILGIPYVFDVYDCYSDSRNVGGLMKRIMDHVERHIMKGSHLTIIADEMRFSQHRISPSQSNVMVVENVPADSGIPFQRGDALLKDPLKIGYFGNLESKNRGLENLISVVSKQIGVELHVAGLGALSRDFKIASSKFSNIIFYGPMTHKDGMDLLGSCHVVCGLYYLTVRNHVFAAPNKYFEHLMLGRPMISSNGTPPGIKVEKFNTGWSIGDDTEDLRRKVDEIKANRASLAEKGAVARAIWEERYSGYFEQVVIGQYLSRCAEIIRRMRRVNGCVAQIP